MSKEREQDEIIAEVRAIRDRLAARHGYDVDRLYEEAKRRTSSPALSRSPAFGRLVRPGRAF